MQISLNRAAVFDIMCLINLKIGVHYTMKKLITALLLVCLPLTVQASNGDICGQIYSTDILAYVNDVPINSYNIGGRTVIIAEDLYDNDNGVYYGFGGWYDDELRVLTIHSTGYGGIDEYRVERGSVGRVTGNIYETDIKVMFNEQYVPSYNIGGKTAICIEDLGLADETSRNYEYGWSDYMCRYEWSQEKREIRLYTFMNHYDELFELYDNSGEFILNDDELIVTTNEMSNLTYGFEINSSNEFSADTYKLKPVYYNGVEAGLMYINNSGIPYVNLKTELFTKPKRPDYDTAKAYIENNFSVQTKYEDENAMVYLAERDGTRYILFAMKNGKGVVNYASFDSFYTTVEIQDNDKHGKVIYVSPFAGPHGATSMITPIYTAL